LTRAEIVLAGWDKANGHLRESSLTKAGAKEDIEDVIATSQELIHDESDDQASVTDRVLHKYLIERARAIENVWVTDKPDADILRDINRELQSLEKEFDEFARGESPRLLIKQSKVLRRLWAMQYSPSGSRDLVLEADRCLTAAGDIAKYGAMSLYETDVELERAKLFLYEAKYPTADSDPPEVSLKHARTTSELAGSHIHSLEYWKRLPEWEALQRSLESFGEPV
jgi:hypothetical protein